MLICINFFKCFPLIHDTNHESISSTVFIQNSHIPASVIHLLVLLPDFALPVVADLPRDPGPLLALLQRVLGVLQGEQPVEELQRPENGVECASFWVLGQETLERNSRLRGVFCWSKCRKTESFYLNCLSLLREFYSRKSSGQNSQFHHVCFSEQSKPPGQLRLFPFRPPVNSMSVGLAGG